MSYLTTKISPNAGDVLAELRFEYSPQDRAYATALGSPSFDTATSLEVTAGTQTLVASTVVLQDNLLISFSANDTDFAGLDYDNLRELAEAWAADTRAKITAELTTLRASGGASDISQTVSYTQV